MSYKITFKNRLIIHTEVEKGLLVKAMWMDGENERKFEINGNAYIIGNIISIEKSNEDFVDPFTDESRLIESKACFGTRSIQKEINDIAKDEAGKGWPKLVTDKKWREKTRRILAESGAEFCDYKEKKCFCYETK